MGKRVDIKTGFSCNNYCKFCVQGDKRDRYDDKSTERVKEIIKKAKKNHNDLVFTGGEVTLRNDLPELVGYAKKMDYKGIQIQTNGRRFAYIDFCKELIDKGANQFAISLHGSRPEIHEGLTNTRGSFLQVKKGITNLVSLNQEVLTNSVITKENYKDLPQLADLLIDLKVDQFQLAFIHLNKIISNDEDLIDEIVPKKSDVIPYVKRGLQKGIDAGINVMTEAIPLCFLGEYKDYAAEMGQIPDGAVYDADFSIDNYEDYRRNHGKKKGEKCKKCKYYNICEGPWKEYPDIFGWDEFEPVVD